MLFGRIVLKKRGFMEVWKCGFLAILHIFSAKTGVKYADFGINCPKNANNKQKIGVGVKYYEIIKMYHNI